MRTAALVAKPATVAREVLHGLESAWNSADGQAFGALYSADASFITIRGQHIVGADAIAVGHADIFGSVYAGSVNQMELVRADEIAVGVVRAVSVSTLNCPSGPLAGVHHAMSTSIIVRPENNGPWRVVATHNTLIGA